VDQQVSMMQVTAPGHKWAQGWEALCEMIDSPTNPLDLATFDAVCEKRPAYKAFRELAAARIAGRAS